MICTGSFVPVAKLHFILFHLRVGVIFAGRDSFKRPRRGARKAAASSVMASDGFGPKGPTTNFDFTPDVLGEIGNETAASVVEITGVIKWFDVSKGYGFIVPDNGLADVLLHVTCLRRDGFQTAYEGARVVCEALQRPKGLQAFRVLSMDESTAVHPAQMPPPRTHVTVTPTSGLERAQVKWFNRLRGFGFLTRGEGTPDIFVHMETLRRYGITELRPGQTVLVRFGPGPKGLMAAEVRPDGGSHGPASH
jgi:CspA family cold shock protein